jgi:hypothetical protein
MTDDVSNELIDENLKNLRQFGAAKKLHMRVQGV